jgi:hypothetical protein
MAGNFGTVEIGLKMREPNWALMCFGIIDCCLLVLQLHIVARGVIDPAPVRFACPIALGSNRQRLLKNYGF